MLVSHRILADQQQQRNYSSDGERHCDSERYRPPSRHPTFTNCPERKKGHDRKVDQGRRHHTRGIGAQH